MCGVTCGQEFTPLRHRSCCCWRQPPLRAVTPALGKALDLAQPDFDAATASPSSLCTEQKMRPTDRVQSQPHHICIISQPNCVTVSEAHHHHAPVSTRRGARICYSYVYAVIAAPTPILTPSVAVKRLGYSKYLSMYARTAYSTLATFTRPSRTVAVPTGTAQPRVAAYSICIRRDFSNCRAVYRVRSTLCQRKGVVVSARGAARNSAASMNAA